MKPKKKIKTNQIMNKMIKLIKIILLKVVKLVKAN